MKLSPLLKKQGSKLLEIAASFSFGIVLLIPIAVLFQEAFRTSFLPAVLLPRYLQPFITSILLAGMVSISCGVVSVAAVYALRHVSPLQKKIFLRLLPLSLIFPPFVGAIVYIDIYKSPGVLQLIGRSSLIEFIQASFTLTLFLYPYVLLPLYTRVRMIQPSHAKILALYELSIWQKLRLYYIPHVKHVLFNSILLVFLYVCADFGAVSILRMNTLTTTIYEEMILRSGKAEASVISLLFLLFVASVTVFGHFLVGKNTVSTPNAELPQQHKSHPVEKYGSVLLLSVIVLFAVFVPLFKIGSWLGIYWLDTSAFKEVWTSAKYSLITVSLNTFWIAAAVTALTVLLCYGYCLIKMRTLLNRFSGIAQLTAVIHALPGIVAAFSVVIIKQYLPASPFIYWLLFLYGYFLRFAGVAFMNIEPAFRALAPQTVKIGDTFVTRPVEYLKKIILPSTVSSTIQSANYIFFNAVRELNIPLLLLPLGVEVLSMRIWQTASVGLYTYTAPAVAALLVISVPSIFLYIKDRI